MADKIDGGGYKMVASHVGDESTNLWPHTGDDDLPDATTLKRNLEEGRSRRGRHLGRQLNVRLAAADYRRLERLLKRRNLGTTDWIRRCIDLDEQIRPSEAKDYVRKIVPESVAVIAERELVQQAETLMAIAARQSDWEAKRNLRSDAGVVMDAAAYFTDIRKEYERLAKQPSPP